MSEEFRRIITKLKAKRDLLLSQVSRYEQSIRLLEEEMREGVPTETGRFMPRTKRRGPRAARATAQPKSKAAVKKARKEKAPGENLSVREVIREAVLSQTQPFTGANIRSYLEVRHPAASVKIEGDRLSKELYFLRVEEELFDIESKGEKGGAHVYKLKVA